MANTANPQNDDGSLGWSRSGLCKKVKEKMRKSTNSKQISDLVTTIFQPPPAAADLRLPVATMKISHEIERIGDEAKAIARRSRKPPWIILRKFPNGRGCSSNAEGCPHSICRVWSEQEEHRTRDPEVDKLHGKTTDPAKIWWKGCIHGIHSVWNSFISKSIEQSCGSRSEHLQANFMAITGMYDMHPSIKSRNFGRNFIKLFVGRSNSARLAFCCPSMALAN